MNPTLLTAVMIVNLALVAYTVSFVIQYRGRKISPKVLVWQTIGVTLDIIATGFMIWGSRKIALTIHGVIGYSALLFQLADTVKLWRHRSHKGASAKLTKDLFRFSCGAYGWWVVAYVAGAYIAMRMAR